ncbi:MAG: Smr/MutS family protein [Gemmatimonadota bacterium]|nr:Smr/MutS family protein [Gemmatimonadota bacterium]
MTDRNETTSPDGVLVSPDAGTPSALAPLPPAAPGWTAALEALEFDAVIADVAGFAVGSLGAARIRSRRPATDLAWAREELAAVEELAGLERAGTGIMAEPVPELDQVLARLRIVGSVLEGVELRDCRRVLSAARLVLAELRRVEAAAPRVARLIQPAPDKQHERRLEHALDDDGGVKDNASPALAAARGEIHVARERLVQRLEAMLRTLGGEGGVTLRDGRYVIPVPRDLRHRPDGIIHGESASGATLYLEPGSAVPLGNALREAEARALREELKVLRDLTAMLRPAADDLRRLHAMCVAVDDLRARARWAVARDGHAPALVSQPGDTRIVNGRHPLLLITPDVTTVVPFDLALDPEQRTVLLSGPNTGGKSVLLKAVGLLTALAQSGIVPPVGPGSRLPAVNRIFADIGDRQSISASLSTFSAHAAILRDILEHADAAALVLLDEVGSGTDPAEGGALAGASLQALTARGALTFATTHLGALKELATRVAGVVNASLQFDAATLRPTYHLVMGVPGRSYGLAIARRLGLPADVLAEAEAQVPDRERSLDVLLATVEERQRSLSLRESELTARLTEAEARQQALAAQGEAQELRERELRRRERDAERSARSQVRQYLLDARTLVEQAVARVEAGGEAAAREARRTVEQAAAAAAAALRRDERQAGAGREPPLEVDQRVRLSGGTVGQVLERRGDGKVVVRVGSLKLVTDVHALEPLGSAPEPRRPGPAHASHSTREATYEVDLRGMTGDEAEQVVVGALDAAVLADQPYLRIIHGKGTGVVRERVQQIVRGDRRIKSHGFAPPNQGGAGVTLVEFAT